MEIGYYELKNVCGKLGYVFFTKELSLNIIFERTNDQITNRFTDWWHIAYIDKQMAGRVITIPATTKPGLRGSILEPITIKYNGIFVTGTAIIQPGQYRSAWQFRDTFAEFSKYPYFRQVKPINYWRDGDKDAVIDRINPELGVFGTHLHKMSQPGTYGSGEVNNWSKGCMGAPEPELKKILSIVRESVMIYGDIFSVTVIESKDFL